MNTRGKRKPVTPENHSGETGCLFSNGYPSVSKIQVLLTSFYYENPLTKKAVKDADAVYTPAKFLTGKVRKKYNLKLPVLFLPTPIKVKDMVKKNTFPTVCYVGRLDRRKRPEKFFDLAKIFPNVHFIAIGRAQDQKYGQSLQARYSNLPNVEMTGFVNPFSGHKLSDLLEKSWILINTSAREGLPNTYIQACGHQCAILSPVDPDGFASQFGRLVHDNDFSAGLAFLLENNRWKAFGERGFEYVRKPMKPIVQSIVI